MKKQKVKQNYEYSKALIYCRVSSEQQVRDGHGLDSQEQRCGRRAQELNLEVIKVFRDEGVSGSLFERPAMQQLIQFLEDHPTEQYCVIFDDLSRFARDLSVHIQLKSELQARGAKLECLNLKLEDSEEGELVEMMMASVAQYDRKKNRRQVIQKQKARLESGYWPFCPPAGLKYEKIPGHGKALVIVQPFADIYRNVLEMYANYELNTLDEVRLHILKQYAIHNIKRRLSLHGTHSILTQVLYSGYLEYLPWGVERRKAQHEGFISYETFQKVQKKLQQSAKPRIRMDYNPDFPLRNYIKCPSCGRPYTGSWNKGRSKAYPYYWCKTKDCPNKWKGVPRDGVDKEFIRLLKQLQPKEGVFKVVEAAMEDIWDNRKKLEMTEKAGVAKQLRVLKDKIDSLTQLIMRQASEALIQQYEKEMIRLIEEQGRLEQEYTQQKYSDEQFGTAIRVVMEYLKNPLEAWQSEDYQDKRLLLSMYFEEKFVYDKDKGFGTATFPLIVDILRQENMPRFLMVEMPGVKPGSKTYLPFNCSQD